MRASATLDGFQFKEGKVTWLLVRSGKSKAGTSMDAIFDALSSEMKGRVDCRRYDWESEKAKPVIDEFSLTEPPASVIADSEGSVVIKMESVQSEEEMRALLVRISLPPVEVGKRTLKKDTKTD